MTDRSAGRFLIPADHPCLPGHFPGQPLVPGVVLLDAAFALVESGLGEPARVVDGVISAKFLVPVRPDQPVDVRYGLTRTGRVGLACHVGGTLVLQATVGLAERVTA